MTDWHLRVRICALEVDAQTLARDPEGNARELRVLHNEITRLRHRLARQNGTEYPVALDLGTLGKTVRVIADNQHEANRLESAWLRSHPGGGVQRQRAEYSAWARPLMASMNSFQQKRSA